MISLFLLLTFYICSCSSTCCSVCWFLRDSVLVGFLLVEVCPPTICEALEGEGLRVGVNNPNLQRGLGLRLG
jgi:hypothetical protein